MSRPVLRLGTRGSPLALAQAAAVRARLAAVHPELAADDAVIIVPIRTSGDAPSRLRLADEGGKGLFTKEIDEALLAGAIDIAVHSLKDVPSVLPDGLALVAHLPREDPRDALITEGDARRIAELPAGAVVGTASVRRQAQLLHLRPDLTIVPLRGNVGTRLDKLASGAAAATILALAGLRRLQREDCVAAVIPVEDMLPAAGQGIIAVASRNDHARARDLLAAIDDAATSCCAAAERALLAALDGSCRTPIAALATLAGDRLTLDAMLIRPDGGVVHRARRSGAASAARAMGEDAGAELRGRAEPGFFAAPGPA